MKKILIVLILFFLSSNLQAQTWNWSQRLGNIKSDKVTCIKTDDAGFIYIAGYFSNSITLGTNNVVLNFTANASSKEAFVAKLDSTGFCYWARSGGAFFDDRVLGMDVDASGNSVIGGTFWTSGFTIGPIILNGIYGADTGFLIKHDSLGNPLWGGIVDSDGGDDQVLDVALDKYGNVYACGFMSGTAFLCSEPTVTAANPNTDAHPQCYWLTKVSPTGVFQWARTFGNLPWDPDHFKYVERDIAICVDDIGGVYVTGGFDGTRQFGTASFTAVGGHDIFALKYNDAGDFQWAKSGGSDKDDWSNGITSDHSGHIYITGEHRGGFDFDTVHVKNFDKRDVFVIKMNAENGAAYWGKRAGSDLGGERGNDIVADSLCHVYVVGDVNESASFGSSITTPAGNMVQSFIARISPEGSWSWVTTGGEPGEEDRCNAIAIGKGSQLYAAGYFRNTATFPSATHASAGSSDGYFARLKDNYKGKGVLVLNAPNDTVFCEGESINLLQPETDFISYNNPSTITANTEQTMFTITANNNTSYTFIGELVGNCPAKDTVSFNITLSDNPTADFYLLPEEANLLYPEFELINQSSNASSYIWLQNNIPFSSGTDAVIQVDTAGIYCFDLIAKNIHGCKDTATACGKVAEQYYCVFPNAFTPNGDNINDYFTIYSGAPVTLQKLLIYNRWGEPVYSLNNKSFFGVFETWNGSHNNQPATMDTYVYYMLYNINGEQKTATGNISLIR